MIKNKLKNLFTYSQLGCACAARLTRFGRPQRFALSPIHLFTHQGFTFAEMMVVMMILSLVTIATIPAVTRRTIVTSSTGKWKYAADNTNIYYGTDTTQGVAVGATSLGGINVRMLLNTTAVAQNQMSFKEGGTLRGNLMVNSRRNIALGNNITYSSMASYTNTDGIWIGNSVQSLLGCLCNGVAIGNGSSLVGTAFNSNPSTGDAAIGYGSLSSQFDTTAIGYNAIASTGESLIVGNNANCSSGWYNIGIGYNNQIADGIAVISIGANAMTDGYTRIPIIIGSYPAANPTSTFSYYGSTAIGGYGTTGAQATDNNQIRLGTSSNSVSIPGTLTVGRATTLQGNVTLNSVGTTATTALYINGATTGVISASSDRRLKNINNEFTGGLDEIKQLKVYNYTFKKDTTNAPAVGVMAQDLQKVFPNAVTKNKEGYLMIRKEDMFYALLNSIKQLDKMLTDIKARLQQAEDRILALMKVDKMTTKKIKELEATNKKYEARIAKLERLRK